MNFNQTNELANSYRADEVVIQTSISKTKILKIEIPNQLCNTGDSCTRPSDMLLHDSIDKNYNDINNNEVKSFLKKIAEALNIDYRYIIIKSISFSPLNTSSPNGEGVAGTSQSVVDNFIGNYILETFSNNLDITFEIADTNFVNETPSPGSNDSEILNSRLANSALGNFITVKEVAINHTPSPAIQNVSSDFVLQTLAPESEYELVESCNEWKCNEADVNKKCLFSDENTPLYRQQGTEYCCSDCSEYNCNSNNTNERYNYEWIEGKCGSRNKLSKNEKKNYYMGLGNNYFNKGENLYNTCLDNDNNLDNSDSTLCGQSITKYHSARDNYLNAVKAYNPNDKLIPCHEYCQYELNSQSDYQTCIQNNCDGAFLSVNKILEKK